MRDGLCDMSWESEERGEWVMGYLEESVASVASCEWYV